MCSSPVLTRRPIKLLPVPEQGSRFAWVPDRQGAISTLRHPFVVACGLVCSLHPVRERCPDPLGRGQAAQLIMVVLVPPMMSAPVRDLSAASGARALRDLTRDLARRRTAMALRSGTTRRRRRSALLRARSASTPSWASRSARSTGTARRSCYANALDMCVTPVLTVEGWRVVSCNHNKLTHRSIS